MTIRLNEEARDSSHGLYTGLGANIMAIRAAIGNSPDLVVKELKWGGLWAGAVMYMDGMADTKAIADFVIQPLLTYDRDQSQAAVERGSQALTHLMQEVLEAGDIDKIADFDALLHALLSGSCILLLDHLTEGLRIGMGGIEERSVGEPITQTVIRGPMEAFTESFSTNTALIRRRLKDPNLWLEVRQIGAVTKTNVGVMYLCGIVNEGLVDEVRSRLDRIEIDGILESGYIEEMIQDKTLTPFPLLTNTERPDAVAAALLEGRVAIIVDGTPFVLLAPGLFVQYFQSVEDYYQRWDISTLLRLIRFMSFFIALLAPSFYIAVTTFHQEMLPTGLLISLAAQREGVPFPAFIEALLMEMTYEILREAGVRMPRTVGQAVSIVGTLVIGQAAVEAGIVSAGMVIIVSITAIASYVLPQVSMSITVRMIRFVLMGLAASFGLYGMLVGIIALFIHLCTLRSFGIPYMTPFAPLYVQDQKDTLFRLPWPLMKKRPSLLGRNNPVRQGDESSPVRGDTA
ncbi:spore germination protein KA [Paenibacillus phyllosphaerae]|uniref:Spore germination protein KA n=2 Tax=Paenibacillus phyllosphaerae TaxID=274593 RepID=A0A7W5FQ67_9BACL|nr:spore germination protein KA [Paenibacillus phyllosphaerae]